MRSSLGFVAFSHKPPDSPLTELKRFRQVEAGFDRVYGTAAMQLHAATMAAGATSATLSGSC